MYICFQVHLVYFRKREILCGNLNKCLERSERKKTVADTGLLVAILDNETGANLMDNQNLGMYKAVSLICDMLDG